MGDIPTIVLVEEGDVEVHVEIDTLSLCIWLTLPSTFTQFRRKSIITLERDLTLIRGRGVAQK